MRFLRFAIILLFGDAFAAPVATEKACHDNLLLDAIQKSDIVALKVYIKHRAPLDVVDGNPLDFAISVKSTEAAQILLDNGANPNYVSRENRKLFRQVAKKRFWWARFRFYWPFRSSKYIKRSPLSWESFLEKHDLKCKADAPPASVNVNRAPNPSVDANVASLNFFDQAPRPFKEAKKPCLPKDWKHFCKDVRNGLRDDLVEPHLYNDPVEVSSEESHSFALNQCDHDQAHVGSSGGHEATDAKCNVHKGLRDDLVEPHLFREALEGSPKGSHCHSQFDSVTNGHHDTDLNCCHAHECHLDGEDAGLGDFGDLFDGWF